MFAGYISTSEPLLFVTAENYHPEYSGTSSTNKPVLGVMRRCAGVDKRVAPSSPHAPAGCLVSDGCWSRGTVVGIQRARRMDVCERGRGLAVRHQRHVHVRGNTEGRSCVYMFGWAVCARSNKQRDAQNRSPHLHTSAVFICKTAAANTSVFMGASSRNRHRCWDVPDTYLI